MATLSRHALWLAAAGGAALAGWTLMPTVPPVPAAASSPEPVAMIAPYVSAVAVVPSAPALTPAPAPATSVAPVVRLSGVAVGARGGNLALVSVDGRPEVLLRVGDRLGPSATVFRIDVEAMTYRYAGIDRRVFVVPSRAGAVTPGAAAVPAPLPGFVAGAPDMARAGGREPGSGNPAFRQAIERKMQAIASGA